MRALCAHRNRALDNVSRSADQRSLWRPAYNYPGGDGSNMGNLDIGIAPPAN
jgi:hypothetical protein